MDHDEEISRSAIVPDWVLEASRNRRYGAANARGTLNLLDDAATARAAACIVSGRTISLARPVRADDFNTTPENPTFDHRSEYVESPDGLGWGLSHLRLDPHGLQNTHLDALNHVAVGGTFYGGRDVNSRDQGGVDTLGDSGILARALYVDIPTLRGTAWADRPVTGSDIEEALEGAGVRVEPGDALCVDMGRDRFEAHVGHLLGGPETDEDAGGGLAESAARWIADHPVSILAWDMLDSRDAKEAHASAHILGWAIGLPLVDNCDFARLRSEIGPGTRVAGALVLAPLAVPGANGVNLNPLILR